MKKFLTILLVIAVIAVTIHTIHRKGIFSGKMVDIGKTEKQTSEDQNDIERNSNSNELSEREVFVLQPGEVSKIMSTNYGSFSLYPSSPVVVHLYDQGVVMGKIWVMPNQPRTVPYEDINSIQVFSPNNGPPVTVRLKRH